MRDYEVVKNAATKSQQPQRMAENLDLARAQTPVQPSGAAGELLHLQRQYGNRLVRRLLEPADVGMDTAGTGKPATCTIQRDKSATTAEGGKSQPKSTRIIWQDTPEQKAFLEAVLQSHIGRSTKKWRQPLPDLGGSELKNVAGTRVWMRSDAAAAAGNLLAAANQALAAAKQAGDLDAQATVSLSATSGYRGRSKQESLWRQYFTRAKGYYNRTAGHRALLAGGEHGAAAVSYMVDYVSPKIAAPGFSNHQAGLAIDFWQERTKGQAVQNATDQEAVDKWRDTWFFRWLQANAVTYSFEEYSKEPWHWTYRGGAGPGGTISAGSAKAPQTPPTKMPAQSVGSAGAVAPHSSISSSEFSGAIARNEVLGPRLGWIKHVDEIIRYFEKRGYVPPLQTPGLKQFASAVRQYQSQSPPLAQDGVLGPQTWRQIHTDMRQSTSSASSPKAVSAPKAGLGKGAHTAPPKSAGTRRPQPPAKGAARPAEYGPPQGTRPSGATGALNPAVKVRLYEVLKTREYEGTVPNMYLDRKGLVTIGIGCLIDPLPRNLVLIRKEDGKIASREEVELEWKTVKAATSLKGFSGRFGKITKLKLPDDSIRAMFDQRVNVFEQNILRYFPNAGSWPEDAQLGILSMVFALGIGGVVHKFRKFTLALRAQPPNFREAAEQCEIRTPRRPRNAFNKERFLKAAEAEAGAEHRQQSGT